MVNFIGYRNIRLAERSVCLGSRGFDERPTGIGSGFQLCMGEGLILMKPVPELETYSWSKHGLLKRLWRRLAVQVTILPASDGDGHRPWGSPRGSVLRVWRSLY